MGSMMAAEVITIMGREWEDPPVERLASLLLLQILDLL